LPIARRFSQWTDRVNRIGVKPVFGALLRVSPHSFSDHFIPLDHQRNTIAFRTRFENDGNNDSHGEFLLLRFATGSHACLGSVLSVSAWLLVFVRFVFTNIFT
jgi:hypothetical protein